MVKYRRSPLVGRLIENVLQQGDDEGHDEYENRADKLRDLSVSYYEWGDDPGFVEGMENAIDLINKSPRGNRIYMGVTGGNDSFWWFSTKTLKTLVTQLKELDYYER